MNPCRSQCFFSVTVVHAKISRTDFRFSRTRELFTYRFSAVRKKSETCVQNEENERKSWCFDKKTSKFSPAAIIFLHYNIRIRTFMFKKLAPEGSEKTNDIFSRIEKATRLNPQGRVAPLGAFAWMSQKQV